MTAPGQPANRISPGEWDGIMATLEAVDQRGRDSDAVWGFGRLPSLCGVELATRFASQKRKLSEAVWSRVFADVKKHGEAMIRAYDKLDQIAREAGHQTIPPEQWEFEVGGELVILVKDLRQVSQVQRHDRACQVWSLDEIANVVRMHPILVAAKQSFPGATVDDTRPGRTIKRELNEAEDALPF